MGEQRRVYPGRRTYQRLLWLLTQWIFDLVSTILEIFAPSKRPQVKPSECDDWSDDEIIQRFRSMPGLESSLNRAGQYKVRWLCDDTVGKWVDPPEALIMELVRSQTTIPTPHIRRKVPGMWDDELILMEYIEGRQLSECWSSLSFWSRLRIAFTLHQYIRQLRQIRTPYSSVPGPPSETPQDCSGPAYFGMRPIGPFPDCASLSHFFNDLARANPWIREPFDDSRPLVLTHNDLSMRNVIIGLDGKVWIIDWGWAGFYPEWFEYMSTQFAAENDDAPDSWWWLIPLIADPYFAQEAWMHSIGCSVY
ncbi:hypothetical protein BOTBODRAFT_153306 [Botryobasidium botryosum FD-172 SS1]|uniref:Aminoglycoside phosphotransferase domain-containing protein n=1 Tax=Botryobasidium botryosum (strain FD-172 SS1) TaxID=930990 RepID=A0A067MUY1_BOTB1|nr:hypothetical protein BOTBODRAFT_153306 [Botryobasidium botryosum FD-172 SS1]